MHCLKLRCPPQGDQGGHARARSAPALPGDRYLESRPEVYIRYHERSRRVLTPAGVRGVVDRRNSGASCPPAGASATRQLRWCVTSSSPSSASRGECLTCSAGIAPNPWLAKIASDLQKPDGLVVIEASDLPTVLHPLALRDLPGIGANLEKRLRAGGITSVAALTAASCADLHRIWGQHRRGTHVAAAAR